MKPARWAALDAVIHSRLPLSCRAIYSAIHTACGESGECDFDQQEFADSLHIPRRSLQRAIAKLRDTGHVIVENTQTINWYVLPWAERLRPKRIEPQSEVSTAPPAAQSANPTAPLSAPPVAQWEGALRNKVLKTENNDVRTPFDESPEWVRQTLRQYPLSSALAGLPDDDIVRRTMKAAGDSESLAFALVRLHNDYATPTKNWAWFPAAIARTLQTVSIGAKAS